MKKILVIVSVVCTSALSQPVVYTQQAVEVNMTRLAPNPFPATYWDSFKAQPAGRKIIIVNTPQTLTQIQQSVQPLPGQTADQAQQMQQMHKN